MRKFFVSNKQITAVLLVLALIFSLTACSKDKTETVDDLQPEEPAGEMVFDFSAIDPATVSESEDSVSFTATAEDGTALRFQGFGITVTQDGVQMIPGGRLFSLDYIGKIEVYWVETADGQEHPFDGGVAYANTANPESMMNLAVAMATGVVSNAPMDMSEHNVGFLAAGLNAGWPQAVTIRKLRISVDPDAEQVFYKDLDPESIAYEWLNGDLGYRIDWATVTVSGLSLENYAHQKIQGSNVVRSDIIAGIDRSSIVTEGTTTFFTSAMSDGTQVRFEGENIKIDENGICITAQSSVVSLDAVGKIYGYYPTVENRAHYEGMSVLFNVGYGYTYSSAKTSVERASEVHTWTAFSEGADFFDGTFLMPVAVFEPNFIQFSGDAHAGEDFYLSSLVVCYDPSEKVTRMVEAALNGDFSGYYMEGERYDSSKEESADLEGGALDFYLILKPDTQIADMAHGAASVWYVPKAFYEVGALRDAAGNELDKDTAILAEGCTLDIIVGDSNIRMPLDVVPRYYGAQTMNDLVPYAYPAAVGELNTLVVPVIWADQTDMANDDTLKLFREGIGRIVDENGTVTDYSDTTDDKFALSEYFDIASYGKLKITSFMTDWYYSDQNFADVWDGAPDELYANTIMDWVRATYPHTDWSRYDRDGNGYVDSMVILNAGVMEGEGIPIISYSGAINHRASYYGDLAGTPDAPRVNNFTNVGYSWLQDNYNTIIHEFSHGLGLIDYYDVMYSGIDAVGTFDMQSGSYGDWNAYSKLAVGWMEPQVVTGLEAGESVELTVGSSALTDDVIIIPAAGGGYEGPFSEYIMLDLFTDDGVNEYDTERDMFDLKDAAGVRISHVNAKMEKRTNAVASVVDPGEPVEYTIGTIHIANNYTGNVMGQYNVEVIQSGGRNTFTDLEQLDTVLSREDLFYAGDTFTAEDYSEFLYQGRMDDGSEFGYAITVVSIKTDADGNPLATVRITRK